MVKWFACVNSVGKIVTCFCQVEETAKQWRLVRDCVGYSQCYTACNFRQNFSKNATPANFFRDSQRDALEGLHDEQKMTVAAQQNELNRQIALLNEIAKAALAA